MAVLVHLNGPPAVGKSTIAVRLSAERPLGLAIDIDEIRVRLGGWASNPASKAVARHLGLTMAQAHLASGNDVMLPQLLVSDNALDEVERTAGNAGATYIEVILVADAGELIERARSRSDGCGHPRDLVPLDELDGQVRHALERLTARAAGRSSTRFLDVTGLSLDQATTLVRTAIE